MVLLLYDISHWLRILRQNSQSCQITAVGARHFLEIALVPLRITLSFHIMPGIRRMEGVRLAIPAGRLYWQAGDTGQLT